MGPEGSKACLLIFLHLQDWISDDGDGENDGDGDDENEGTIPTPVYEKSQVAMKNVVDCAYARGDRHGPRHAASLSLRVLVDLHRSLDQVVRRMEEEKALLVDASDDA